MSEDNVDRSFAERRLTKLEDHKLELTGLRQRYDHLINPDADDPADDPKLAKLGHPGTRKIARTEHIENFRNSINDEPLPDNVIPIFKPGIETNGYKA